MLPASFYSTIAAGTRALLAEENRLRKLSCNGDPRVLLALRDVSGLRMRLDYEAREMWEEGWGFTIVTGQDIGVLNELADRYGDSPYADQGGSPFRELAKALEWYAEQDL
jgi:hypothetical protein